MHICAALDLKDVGNNVNGHGAGGEVDEDNRFLRRPKGGYSRADTWLWVRWGFK